MPSMAANDPAMNGANGVQAASQPAANGVPPFRRAEVVYEHQSSTPKVNYSNTYTIQEVKPKAQTWGVQFCHRPNYYQLHGNAACWEQRLSDRRAAKADVAHGRPVPRRKAACSIEPNRLDLPMELPGDRGLAYRFATVNGRHVRIYRTERYKKPVLASVFEDEDKNEMFYCVAWTFNAKHDQRWGLVAAGLKGIVRVIDPLENKLVDSLVGHGDEVHDVKAHPRDPALIVTASKDNSLRMWNLRTGAAVALFLGFQGHRWAVLSVDFDVCGHRFVTTSMDNSIRIWNITDDDEVMDGIEESHKAANLGVTDRYKYVENGVRKKVVPKTIQQPVYNSKNLHKEIVDCAMFVGNLVISKSVSNRMYLWNPGADRWSLSSLSKGMDALPFVLLDEYKVKKCDKWFIQFCLDRDRKVVACGTEKGAIYLYRLDQLPVEPMCVLHPKSASRKVPGTYVRQTSFSDDAKILVSVDDNSFLSQYDLTNPRKQAAPESKEPNEPNGKKH